MRLGWASAGVIAAAALGAGVTQGCASHRHGHGYGYGHYDAQDTYRIGFERGFHDGAEHGAEDARDREGFDFAHDKRYRNGDHGYERHYGPRVEYAAGYRRGYEAGYRRAYASRAHRHRGSDDACYLRHEYDDRYEDPYRYD